MIDVPSNVPPLVSVIVPVYNVEKYLARCLDSIIGQTYQNLEIILVNDGSTDGSGKICCQYAQKDPRVCLFTQENKGQSAARNVGLDNMNGQYVVFVDSDDYISHHFVEILLEGLLENEVLICQCNDLIVKDAEDYAGIDTMPDGSTYFGRKMSRDDVFDAIGTEVGSFFGSPCGKVFDREIFKELRYPIGKIFEDAALVHSIYARIDEIYHIDLELYAYRQSRDSTTRENGAIYLHADYIEALLERLSFFQQYGVDKYVDTTGKEILQAYSCLSEYPKPKELKRRMRVLEERMYQITGRRFFSLKYTLFKAAPRAYQFVRKCYKRIRVMLKI